jgi:GNAT superfamily N-acetyltransferase
MIVAEDRVDLSVRQFSEAWRLMCTGVAGHTAAVADGVEYIFSGCPIPFFNVAFPTGRNISAARLKAGADGARAWASDKGVAWLFLVTYEALAAGTDAAAILDGCGYAPMQALTGMIAQQVAPVTNIPDGLELTVPNDDSACGAVLDVNGLAYAMDLEAGKPLVGTRAFWANHFPVLGLAGGKPACSAAVMMVDGYRYVALVATDPAQQRRGFADAAMRRALELSARAHGERPTLLHATDAGRPVYERMGYESISTHTIFIEKRFLEGH